MAVQLEQPEVHLVVLAHLGVWSLEMGRPSVFEYANAAGVRVGVVHNRV